MQRCCHVVQTGNYKVFVEQHGSDPARATIVLVNGALATTTSFRQMTKFLTDHFNVILYDLPYSGQSRTHNPGIEILTKEDEVFILASLVDRFDVNHIVSMSWGGVAGLLTAARRPKSLRSAMVGSFSPVMNSRMTNYVSGAKAFLDDRRNADAAQLLNDTVGKYLPRLLKLYNHKFLVNLDEAEVKQVHFHVQQILELDVEAYLERLKLIEVPVLFINGELDEYTSGDDVLALARVVRHASFDTVPGSGHFLELESRSASAYVRGAVLRFLKQDACTAANAARTQFGPSVGAS